MRGPVGDEARTFRKRIVSPRQSLCDLNEASGSKQQSSASTDDHLLALSISVLAERILDPNPIKGNPSDFLIDIHFNYRDARLRTPAEYQQLLSAAGFGQCAWFRPLGFDPWVSILEGGGRMRRDVGDVG